MGTLNKPSVWKPTDIQLHCPYEVSEPGQCYTVRPTRYEDGWFTVQVWHQHFGWMNFDHLRASHFGEAHDPVFGRITFEHGLWTFIPASPQKKTV